MLEEYYWVKGLPRLYTALFLDYVGLTWEAQRRVTKTQPSEVLVGVIDSGCCKHATCITHRQLQKRRSIKEQTDESRLINDEHGHGTSCASLIAGNYDHNAYYKGVRCGLVRGVLPKCKLAIYKLHSFHPEVVKTAVQKAIADQVNFLNMSFVLSEPNPDSPFSDQLSISSLHATRRGILVCVPAGNRDTDLSVQVVTSAPFQLCVGGCNSPKKFITDVVLVNSDISIEGLAININDSEVQRRLIAVDTRRHDGKIELVKAKVAGKIVMCNVASQDELPDKAAAKSSGAVGLIIVSNAPFVKLSYTIPAVCVTPDAGEKIQQYLEDHKRGKKGGPIVGILGTREVDNPDYPGLADVSPRTPNQWSDEIQKPNILACAENVICAGRQDKESIKQRYKIRTGTSFATATVCGAVAYLKAKHPTWSGSTIMSAIMTSADPLKPKVPTDILVSGAGILNLLRAEDPGLVYNMLIEDICRWIQGLDNCDEAMLQASRAIYNAPPHELLPTRKLNYPSFMTTFEMNATGVYVCEFERRVTYVGEGPAEFGSKLTSSDPQKLELFVDPPVLNIAAPGDEIDFTLTARVKEWNAQGLLSGELIWTFGHYSVRSTIIVVARN